MLIDANHLKLTLGTMSILQDVSLHMRSGEIYGLLGPNGAGKSTTISVLLGLCAADRGDLKLFGRPPDDIVALRRRIGVMPEHAGFYGWMTATEYLVWYAGFYGGLSYRSDALLQRVGLGDTGNKPIGQYSRGMKQRLALARALVHRPELLILDEPTNGLDPRGRREIHDLLLALAKEEQVGILLCTHLLDDVERLCNTIGIIDQGRTIIEASLDELLVDKQSKGRFRVRMVRVPKDRRLPPNVQLLNRDEDWWTFEISPEAGAASSADPGHVWQDLMVCGWSFSEIQAEENGLEDLYLRLTGTVQETPVGVAP